MEQILEGHLQTLPTAKKEECRQVFCLWLTPTGSVKKLTLFLPGLALLQSPRIKYLVAGLVFIRFVERVCHQWHTSTIPLKTSQPCDVIQEDLQLRTSQININGSTTAIKFLLKWESRGMETSTTMANHDPRMNRTNPKYRAFRHRWYLKYLVWFLQLFVDCHVCSGYCLQLLCVFLECVLLPCACACFGPSALKILKCVKPWIGSLSRMCSPSHPLMSARVAYIKWN
jgi:hypothetical protein